MERPYAWIHEGPIGVAATLTLLQGVADKDIIVAFGGAPAHTRLRVPGILGDRGFSRGHSLSSDWLLAQVWLTHVGEWTLVTEENGFRGVEADLVDRLRADRQVSVYWSVNGDFTFLYAEHGTIVAACQDDWGNDSRSGLNPGRVDEWLRGLPLERNSVLPADDYVFMNELGLVVAERITGHRLTPAIFTESQTYFECASDGASRHGHPDS